MDSLSVAKHLHTRPTQQLEVWWRLFHNHDPIGYVEEIQSNIDAYLMADDKEMISLLLIIREIMERKGKDVPTFAPSKRSVVNLFVDMCQNNTKKSTPFRDNKEHPALAYDSNESASPHGFLDFELSTTKSDFKFSNLSAFSSVYSRYCHAVYLGLICSYNSKAALDYIRHLSNVKDLYSLATRGCPLNQIERITKGIESYNEIRLAWSRYCLPKARIELIQRSLATVKAYGIITTGKMFEIPDVCSSIGVRKEHEITDTEAILCSLSHIYGISDAAEGSFYPIDASKLKAGVRRQLTAAGVLANAKKSKRKPEDAEGGGDNRDQKKHKKLSNDTVDSSEE